MDYVADFETTTEIDDCRVWAWAVCEVGNTDNIHFGNNIQTFVQFIEQNPGAYWFHNLAFDGEFIIHFLLSSGWQWSDDPGAREFSTLISDTGKFYQLELVFAKKRRQKTTVLIKDSLKKINASVDRIAKDFKLPIKKLDLDYRAKREPGHELTAHERDYIANDVRIVALALEQLFNQGMTRLTIGSDALNTYKDQCQHWKQLFPVMSVEMDANIRRAYKGGWVYTNPKYQATVDHPKKTVGSGIVLDVNSLYPSVMYNRDYPQGEPVYFKGEYTHDDIHPLYIQFVCCHAKLKPGHFPMLQIKHSPYFANTEYISDTGGYVDLALTNVDWRLLTEHYNVTVHSYMGGYKFRRCRGIFCEYIDHWMMVKNENTGARRAIAKLMLNGLYGKFATHPNVTGKVPYLKDDLSVGYHLGEEDIRSPIYAPVGCFVTAYAREVTITAAQACYDRFLYADTDSIHLLGDELPNIDIHPNRLGAWKEEVAFSKARYIRAKTYVERVTHVGTLQGEDVIMTPTEPFNQVRCAGMPDSVKKTVTFNNFVRGHSWPVGKLRPKHVPGGIVLVDTPFTIK